MQLTGFYGKRTGVIIGYPTDETPLICCYYSLKAKKINSRFLKNLIILINYQIYYFYI